MPMSKPNHRTKTIKHQIAVQFALSSRRNIPAAVSLRHWVNATLVHQQQASCELTVRFVSEAEIADLNQCYRNKSGTTNVLSFPAPSMPVTTPFKLLGDVLICPAVALRESTQQHKKLKLHIAHLVVHGVLHLLGYDHIKQDDADIMENLERRIMTDLGFPDPYLTGTE